MSEPRAEAPSKFMASWMRLQSLYPCILQKEYKVPKKRDPGDHLDGQALASGDEIVKRAPELRSIKCGASLKGATSVRDIRGCRASPVAQSKASLDSAVRAPGGRSQAAWFEALVRCEPLSGESGKLPGDAYEAAFEAAARAELTETALEAAAREKKDELRREWRGPQGGAQAPLRLYGNPRLRLSEFVASLWELNSQALPDFSKTGDAAFAQPVPGGVLNIAKFREQVWSLEGWGRYLAWLESTLRGLWLTRTLGELQICLPPRYCGFTVPSTDPGRPPCFLLGYERPAWEPFKVYAQKRPSDFSERLWELLCRTARAGVVHLNLSTQSSLRVGISWDGVHAELLFADLEPKLVHADLFPVDAEEGLRFELCVAAVALMTLLFLGSLAGMVPPGQEAESGAARQSIRRQLEEHLRRLRCHHPWQCIQTLLSFMSIAQRESLQHVCARDFGNAPGEGPFWIFKQGGKILIDLRRPSTYAQDLLAWEGERASSRLAITMLTQVVDLQARKVFAELKDAFHNERVRMEDTRGWLDLKKDHDGKPPAKVDQETSKEINAAWQRAAEDFLKNIITTAHQKVFKAVHARSTSCWGGDADKGEVTLLGRGAQAAAARAYYPIPHKLILEEQIWDGRCVVFSAGGKPTFFVQPCHSLEMLDPATLQRPPVSFLRACVAAWLYAAYQEIWLTLLSPRAPGGSDVTAPNPMANGATGKGRDAQVEALLGALSASPPKSFLDGMSIARAFVAESSDSDVSEVWLIMRTLSRAFAASVRESAAAGVLGGVCSRGRALRSRRLEVMLALPIDSSELLAAEMLRGDFLSQVVFPENARGG